MKTGYCVFVDTICQGPIPAWRDQDGSPIVYPTKREAQADVVDYLMARLQAFLDGDIELEEALEVDDYVVKVRVAPDETITTPDGSQFRAGSC